MRLRADREINGNALFHETGTGEPLVPSGAWIDHTSWNAVVPALAASFRVVTYDLRGHGGSVIDPPDAGTVHDDVADVAALVEHLDLGPVNVAGISSGACIALRLAIERPEMVGRVLAHEPPCAEYLFDDPDQKPLLDDIAELLAATQRRIEAGDYHRAAQAFFDELVLLPWVDLPRATQDLIAAHAGRSSVSCGIRCIHSRPGTLTGRRCQCCCHKEHRATRSPGSLWAMDDIIRTHEGASCPTQATYRT
jgi:pimeloyl-ACP methyl ester carboxylesterase